MTRIFFISLGVTLLYFILDIVLWSYKPDWLETYGKVSSVISHIWAIPALIECERKGHKVIFEHLLACVVISIIYHICEITVDNENVVESFQRADHGFVVALVALIVLHRFYDIWYLQVSFFGILSSSFSFMNLISTGFISLVGFILFLPYMDNIIKKFSFSSINKIENEGVKWIIFGIIFQSVGIFFFFADISPFSHSFHAWWHITSFLGFFCIIKSLNDKKTLLIDSPEIKMQSKKQRYKPVLAF